MQSFTTATHTTLAAVLITALALPVRATDYVPDVVEFKGESTFVFAPSPAFSLARGGTVEFWVVPDWQEDPGYDPVILCYTGSEGPSYLVALLRERDGLGILASGEERYAAFDFTDGQLHHVALSYADGSMAVFIDGKARAVFDLSLPELPVDALWVGTADGATAPFMGALAGLRYWGVPLGQSDIAGFGMRDVLAEDTAHPAFESLKAVSDFRSGQMIVAEDSKADETN